MTTGRTLTLGAALIVGLAGAAAAQAPAAAPQRASKSAPARTASQGQTKRVATATKVTVSADSAKALVRAHDAKAVILSERLRRRNGRLVYDVRVRDQGKKGEHLLRVDAMTGAITEVSMASSAKPAAKRS